MLKNFFDKILILSNKLNFKCDFTFLSFFNMAEEHSVAGYENFIEFMKNFSSSKKEINILFSGEKIDGGN